MRHHRSAAVCKWVLTSALSLFVGLLFVSCATKRDLLAHASAKPNIILDTDIGSDCDDAGALAVLHKLADKGEANILGVMFSSGKNRYGVGVCDAINTYYGRGNLPLGQYQQNDVGDPKNSFSKEIATATNTYHHDVVEDAEELVSAYKKVLTKQPDGSVTIVTVGHPHGLVHLLRDPVGARLVKQKVKRCVSMTYCAPTPIRDWNFGQCGADRYAGEFLTNWPTPLYFSEAGEAIVTGNKKLPLTPINNPVREIYRLYDNALTKGRPSWDEIAVLFAVRPEYFEVEEGSLQQNARLETSWTAAQTNPKQHRVRPRLQAGELQRIIEELISEPHKAP